MRFAHRSDCDERCNGDWCECPCHLSPKQLRAQRATIEAEAAKLRELYDALEGATGGGEAIEEP
jgi:hypothetical protein